MTSVVLIGATGATGKKILHELIKDERISKVTTFTRRALLPTETEQSQKLSQIVVENFDALETSTNVTDWNADVIINALGTTRALAGSGQEFVRIERDFSQSAMTMAKKAGVKKSITLSAQGANASVPGPLWFHPLLYTKTLGEKELAAKGFAQSVFLRPGMLDREQATGGGALIGLLLHLPFVHPLSVSVLAKAAVKAALTDFPESNTAITGNGDITAFAA